MYNVCGTIHRTNFYAYFDVLLGHLIYSAIWLERKKVTFTGVHGVMKASTWIHTMVIWALSIEFSGLRSVDPFLRHAVPIGLSCYGGKTAMKPFASFRLAEYAGLKYITPLMVYLGTGEWYLLVAAMCNCFCLCPWRWSYWSLGPVQVCVSHSNISGLI